MSTSVLALQGSRLPRVCSHPPYSQSYGPEAVELAASAGLVADPWQADVIDVMLAVDPFGRWVCPECGIVVARQNGKGSVYEIRALAGLYLLGEQLIMWSAHEYKTAMEGFRRVLGLIENTDDLRRRVHKVSNTNGDEGIELNGEHGRLITARQRLRFIARSKGSGRGFSGDCNLLDEVFAYTEEQQAALMPTVSARPNAQLVYASSPPLDAATGAPLFALRARGESGDDPALGWFDWGQLPGADLDDPAVWAAANPALGIRISQETVARERRSMTADGFGRERLGIWPETAGVAVISPELWADLADSGAERPADVAFAIDVTPMRDHSAIAMAGTRPDGLIQVAIVDHRPGTDWIPERLAALKARFNPIAVALDGKSPAATLILDFNRAGLAQPDDPQRPMRGDLAILNSSDAATAFGMVVDAARQRRLRHSDDAPLNVALAGAKTRPLGDGSAWARRGNTDISPLVATTLAHWALVTLAEAVTADAAPSVYWL